jgi:hypothetical protein
MAIRPARANHHSGAMNARPEESIATMPTFVRRLRPLVRQPAAFVEMLSLGFATIGVNATLRSIGRQLTEDAVRRRSNAA